jgi:Tol biopolymer transport system component
MTTRGTDVRIRRKGVLLSLVLGIAFSAVGAMTSAAREAEASFPGNNARIAFASERSKGVDNPTGDSEIFTIKPDGTGLKQLTFNTVSDASPVFSPDGTKIAYESVGDQTTNPDGEDEIYLMNALDGTGKTNLTNNDREVMDFAPAFSPDGQWIAYQSRGRQESNPRGDWEIYRMNAMDGSEQKNLSDSAGSNVSPVFSPDSRWIAYESSEFQNTNPEGDSEIYRMNAVDGFAQVNLSNNGGGVDDHTPVFSPDGQKIAYASSGTQPSNSQGDGEVYRMSALDGTNKKNLSNNAGGVADDSPVFSPDGTRIAYESRGKQASNSQGDGEIYRMSAIDGKDKKNLSNNGANEYLPDWGRKAM